MDADIDTLKRSGGGVVPDAVIDGFRRSLDHHMQRLDRRVVAAAKRREADVMRSIATHFPTNVGSAAVSPDGRWLAAHPAAADSPLSVWDLHDPAAPPISVPAGRTGQVGWVFVCAGSCMGGEHSRAPRAAASPGYTPALCATR